MEVGVDESDGVTLVVAWGSETWDEDGPALMLMDRLSDYDEQDRALGMDTYCLCREHQITTYGGVVEWHLTDRHLEIRLNEEAQAELGVDDGFLITHDLDPDRLETIRAAVQRVLARSAS